MDAEDVLASNNKPRFSFLRKAAPIFLALSLGASATFYIATEKPQWLGLFKDTSQREDVDELISEVGELILLPDERPTLAAVTQVEEARDNPFFKNAQNGDIVLIFPGAKKAILYRPSDKRIIEVGGVNIDRENLGEVAGVEETGIQEGSEEEVSPTPAFGATSTLTPTPSLTSTTTPTPTPTPSP